MLAKGYIYVCMSVNFLPLNKHNKNLIKIVNFSNQLLLDKIKSKLNGRFFNAESNKF